MSARAVYEGDVVSSSACLRCGCGSRGEREGTGYVNRRVQRGLSSVKGVQRADVLGGRVFAMRVWLKPEELAARNISPAEVRSALQANNALAAVGATKGTMFSVSLVANTDLKNVDQFKRLV